MLLRNKCLAEPFHMFLRRLDLEVLAGAGGRAEAFQSRPGMLACSPAERPRPDPSVSVFSSFREGRWSELTCVCAHS